MNVLDVLASKIRHGSGHFRVRLDSGDWVTPMIRVRFGWFSVNERSRLFSFAGLFLAPIMFYLRYPELRMQKFCKNFLRRRPSPESKMAPGSAPENEFFSLCSWESVCSHFSVAGRTLGRSQGVRCALWWSSRRGYGKIWRFVDYLEKLKFVVHLVTVCQHNG